MYDHNQYYDPIDNYLYFNMRIINLLFNYYSTNQLLKKNILYLIIILIILHNWQLIYNFIKNKYK